MQSIQGVPTSVTSKLSGAALAGSRPLTTQQRTVLERLVTRIVALGQQQHAEVWAAVRHELGLARDGELLACHFAMAKQRLTQRLDMTLRGQSVCQTLSRLSTLLGLGNNRQAVSDHIRQAYGQTTLSQLTPEQRAQVLHLLEAGELTPPQPQLRPQTERPLLPTEHNALNQAAGKLAAATGKTVKQIWQSMLELAGLKEGEQFSARHYAPLSTWLSARLTLAPLAEITVRQLQKALKHPMDDNEWHTLIRYSPALTASSVLIPAQVQVLLNQLVLLRTGQPVSILKPRQRQPAWRRVAASLTRGIHAMRSWLGRMLLVLVLLAIGWVVLF